MKHATIKLGEYKIPLIGIPATATEYECQCCGKIVEIEEIKLNEDGNQFLCKKCRE